MGADDRATEKRRRIIDAARFLILRNGLRATTMEAIAREAGIAKQTLYAQFPDKDAVVGGIIEEVVDTLCGAVDLGLAGDAPVALRVGRALAGKFAAIENLLGGSPHADEIYSEHTRLAERFKAADENVERQIADALSQAGAKDGRGLARLVIAASYGIGRRFSGEAAIREAIVVLCEAVIGAEIDRTRRAVGRPQEKA